MRLAPYFACVALVLALFFSTYGVGSSAKLPDQSSNLTSADEVLAAAREAVALVISCRSEQCMLVKSQAYGRDFVMRNIPLTWSTPDHLHLRSGGTEKGGEEQAFELIATDSRVFAREPKTGNIWEEYETDPNPEDRQVGGGLALVRRFSAAPGFGARSVQQELPGGVPAEVVDDLPLQQSDSTYHLYVSTSDFLPRRLLTEDQYKVGDILRRGAKRRGHRS